MNCSDGVVEFWGRYLHGHRRGPGLGAGARTPRIQLLDKSAAQLIATSQMPIGVLFLRDGEGLLVRRTGNVPLKHVFRRTFHCGLAHLAEPVSVPVSGSVEMLVLVVSHTPDPADLTGLLPKVGYGPGSPENRSSRHTQPSAKKFGCHGSTVRLKCTIHISEQQTQT